MSDTDKEVENQILEAGVKLVDPPSSVDELLSLLDKLFLCLSEVEQSPPDSMQNALSPLMKALVGGKLFKHSDIEVKVAVAACISEITRITAPEAPYDDEQMKEVFKLIVSLFEDVLDNSSRSYSKRISILETVAKVRSCVVMLDLECDALLIEMFQHFLKTIRDHHSENVFSSMENIMTLVLDESEDIHSEMLSPILHYVKKDDEVSQVSRRLAEKVLSNCASKLKTYLTEAVKSLGVPLDSYSNIVASICEGTFSALQQGQVAANEKKDSQGHITSEAEVEDNQKAAEICTPERTDAPRDESGISNGVVQQNDSSVDNDSTNKQDNMGAKDEPQQLDNPSNTNLDNSFEEKPDVEHQIKEKKNQSSSVKQADSSKNSNNKETEPATLLDSKDVLTSPPDDSSVNAATSSENVKETSVQALPSKTSADETANGSSPSRADDLLEQSHPKKTSNQKEKESSTKEVKPSASIATEEKESSTKEVKPSASIATEEASENPITSEVQMTKKSGKKVASSSKAKPTVPPSKKSTTETKAAKQSEKKSVESDNAQESTKPKEDKKKPGRGKAMDDESLNTSSGGTEKPAVSSEKSASKSKKEAKQPVEESPSTNTKRKRSLEKGKASNLQNHDENLVGSRVKVWWPMDQAYYKGVVNSYDSAKKKHLVCYDDGDQEILNLKKQKWYFLDESGSSEDEEAADQIGQDKEASTAPQRKKAKTGKQSKMDSSAKKGGGAGSSKSKAAPATKSGKKSQDDKTESAPKDSKEADREEDMSEQSSEEEETPKTIGKSGSSKPNVSKSGKSKDQGASGTSKDSSKKKEEPSKTPTTTKSKSGPAKSAPAKSKTGKGKAKSGSASTTPASKAKESDAESESEETIKAQETATKGNAGKSQGSQAKSGKKRKR